MAVPRLVTITPMNTSSKSHRHTHIHSALCEVIIQVIWLAAGEKQVTANIVQKRREMRDRKQEVVREDKTGKR